MSDSGPDPHAGGDGGHDPDDAAWKAIVENYGDHPAFVDPTPPPPAAAPSASLERLFQPWRAEEWSGETTETPGNEDPFDPDVDGFVPPETPPQPLPPPDRLVAWLGIFGAPVVLLICLFARYTPPSLITYGLIGWFIGGFGYLVAKMPREPRDPWDDGAQV